MILLIDIGNTRIKWATLTESGLGEQSADVHANWDRDQTRTRIFDSTTAIDRVIVSNVGGERMSSLIREAALAARGTEPEFVVSTAEFAGVRNAYPQPHKLGVDRWLTLIAAHNDKSCKTCIASVGTAMTIDGLDATGRHLGGLILPGPDLMVSSLLHNTSDIAARATTGAIEAGIFADNTLGAIHQGAVHALAAVVDRAYESMIESFGEDPKLLLTGGASDSIAKLLHFSPSIVPDLVLRGLAVVARNTAQAR
jgi:type III pantothenate kinase